MERSVHIHIMAYYCIISYESNVKFPEDFIKLHYIIHISTKYSYPLMLRTISTSYLNCDKCSVSLQSNKRLLLLPKPNPFLHNSSDFQVISHLPSVCTRVNITGSSKNIFISQIENYQLFMCLT